MKTKNLVTRDSLQTLLDSSDRAKVIQVVGRALAALLTRQTVSEAQCNTTSNDNGVGFTGADAWSGALTAKSFIKNRSLQEWQVDRWLVKGKTGYSRLTKYWKQLDAIAQAKAAGVPDAAAQQPSRVVNP